tara:strand:+ start:40 stop:936 length:897 start_codon:yes stop_codon:yes gene_type:complete
MKFYLSFFFLIIISSCGKIPAPSLISPKQNVNVQAVSFGPEPINYQKILKEYLISNLKNYKTAKVEFINAPSKISIDHLGDNYTGYRVCLSINERRGDYFIGYRNHFFLISDNKINLHLFDSGLLTIPFEYCVSRNIEKEIFIDDIPDEKQISVETMDQIKLTSKEDLKYKKLEIELEKLKKENKELKIDKNKLQDSDKPLDDLAKIEVPEEVYTIDDNIYILCIFDDKEMTYVFNDSKETFRLIDKLNIVPYDVSFNEAYIVATNEAIELSINRVSGDAVISDIGRGQCKLTDRRKF